jgi:zinc/manganese transport system substrate-binding protein
MPRTTAVFGALAVTSALVLAGCSTTAAGTDAGASDADTLSVVASTSVYGQIVEAIGGDAVEVTAIVDSPTQDPHSYEAGARDQLAVQRAGLVVENGGGYDGFLDAIIEASGSEAPVITAVEYSHDWPENAGHEEHDHADDEHADEEAHADEDAHADEAEGDGHDHHDHEHIEGFNEHVWYDPHTIVHVAEAIADELSELRPDDADTFAANLETFSDGIADLESELETLAASVGGKQVFVTEPVPLYLTAAAGLINATPEAFSEAVEEGNDVPPATLLEALGIVESRSVSVVISNTQTGGAETTEVLDAAEAAGIPLVQFAETLPTDATYIEWMHDNIAALHAALQG